MTETMKVKPAEGLLVRDPVTREALPAKGGTVPRNAYWLRRLRDGDVIDAAPPAKESKPPKKES